MPASTSESRDAAATIAAALDAVSVAIDGAADELGRIDRIAGDGDHGIGMQRGARAARAAARTAVEAGAGARTTLQRAAEAWSDRAGGTSGAIWGEFLRTLGADVGDDLAVTPEIVARAVASAKDAVMVFGKAKVGDKTMVDAIVPFADELVARVDDGLRLADAWRHAATAAEDAALATATLAATIGRARSHGDRSIGTPDPGAVSFALVCATVYDVLDIDREQ